MTSDDMLLLVVHVILSGSIGMIALLPMAALEAPSPLAGGIAALLITGSFWWFRKLAAN